MRPAAERVSIEEMRSLPWLTEDDSGYDESSQEKRIKLEPASGGAIAVAVFNKHCDTTPAGNLDNNNNNNDNSSGNNSINNSNLHTTLRVLKRKRAVPQ